MIKNFKREQPSLNNSFFAVLNAKKVRIILLENEDLYYWIIRKKELKIPIKQVTLAED